MYARAVVNRGQSCRRVERAATTHRVDRERVGLSTASVRRILRDPRGDHFIAVNGGQGRPTTYRRVAE